MVTAYWRTNLTMRQLAPLFGVSKSTADRIIGQHGPLVFLQPRRRFAKDAVLIVDGTLVPTPDHDVAEQSKNYRGTVTLADWWDDLLVDQAGRGRRWGARRRRTRVTGIRSR